MAKPCEHDGCNNPRFSHGFCRWHQSSRTDAKWTESQTKAKGKKNKRISPVSQKQLDRLAKYRPIRDKYLKEHPECEVHDCNKSSTNIHHKKGREGSLLWDADFFLACCETCHPKRIHENPEWAYEYGYLISRI